jgi:hypothetical protein
MRNVKKKCNSLENAYFSKSLRQKFPFNIRNILTQGFFLYEKNWGDTFFFDKVQFSQNDEKLLK